MARQRRGSGSGRGKRPLGGEHESPHQSVHTPQQEDDADILAEAEAEPNGQGEFVVSGDKVAELGAVDTQSVLDNRRNAEIVNKKRANVKNVSFNSGDPISTYDNVIATYPPNTIDIIVRRLTGTEVTKVLAGRPRNGVELYRALEALHGVNEEAEYEVRFRDTARKEWRGTTRITMPDTRASAHQGQQPMAGPPPYYPPHGYPPPPAGYSPAPAPGYAPQQAQPAPYGQQPAPVVVQAPGPPGFDIESMRQMFEMFRSMMPQQPQQAPVQPMMPPPPPSGSDPQATMQWMQQMFEMFRSMMTQPPAAPVQPQAAPSPAMRGGPPIPTPPGMWWVEGLGFVPIERLLGVNERPQFRGPRPPPSYQPGGGGGDQGTQYGHQGYRPPPSQQQQPQRERGGVDQFREALTVVKSAMSFVEEANSILPNGRNGGDFSQEVVGEGGGSDDDDGPVKIIDTGSIKLVVDKNDGSLRKWETGWANMGSILKWAGEQREAIQQSAERRQQREQLPQQRSTQQLPEGYIEVRPGYQPPPGYRVEYVDPNSVPFNQAPHQHQQPPPQQQYQQPLPPVPDNLPPPIQAMPPPPQRQAWAAPSIPEGEG